MTEYELRHILWGDIKYDRSSLIAFMERYFKVKNSKEYKDSHELRWLEKIKSELNEEWVQKVLDGDDETCRRMFYEKVAREASLDMMTEGKFSRRTISILSSMSVSEYQLIVQRTQELVESVQSIQVQQSGLKENVPGA
jgi:hypothetical protein